MKSNFTFILMWLLCVFSLNTKAQTQFWSDTFESSPSSGTRTPEENGGTTSSYFRLTDGSTISQVVAFSGKEGTNYWAGEDHNGTGTGFSSAGTLPSDPLNELQIEWTGINISGKSNLSFKGLIAAASTNEPWDNQTACLSGVGTTNTDYIIVEYSIDGSAYVSLIRFYNRGSASGTGDKYLFEDTNNDGCGDGTQLTNVFGEFTKNIPGTGTTMSLRIRVFSEGNNEEWGIDNFRLFEVPSCTAPSITGNPPNRSICNGNNTTFSVTATGATAYQWQVNTGSGFTDITNGGVYSNATTSTLTITGATAGMNGYLYRCVAKDGSCITNSSSGTLNISNITSSTAKNDVLCFGNSTGSAAVSPTGGIGSYTYSWSPSGGTGSIATGLAAGTYTVTITDAIGCQITKTITINQPAAALMATSSSTTVSCNGGSNGTATVVASGGTPGYTYSWSPSGGTSATATGLAAGTYSVTITDANSCTKTITGIVVGQPAAALNGTTTTTTVSCFGGSNGTATVTPSGGTPGYTYSWAPSGGTAATATGLAVGTYSVTITDANACTKTITGIVVGQPVAALNGITTTTAVSCFGSSNGTATVTPFGGTPGYTYSWAPSGGTAATATGLAAGTYSVTITDANACTKTITGIVVGQPVAALNGTTTTTAVSCFGGSNGTATVTPFGGTPGYTYSWAPSGGTAATATGLAAGTYSVTITDANACTKTITGIVVGQPVAALNGTTTTTAVSCFGGSNGTATVTPTGGTSGYTYSWAPSGGTAATATGLAAGTYSVTITDANSCTKTITGIVVGQPAAVLNGTTTTTAVSCFGGSNGTATVTPTGGTSGYTYSWAPSGGTAATATGLAAGTYSVTITDANSCTKTITGIVVGQPAAVLNGTTTTTAVSCFGGSNGTATVTPSGGTPGYTYLWAPSGGTAATATGLSAGNYTVTVTDANGCIATKLFTITQPTAISFTTTSLPGYDYNTSYTQNVVATGGTGSITYAVTSGSLPTGFTLSPAGVISGTSTQVADSNFTVTATDANACTATYNYTLKLNQIPITVTADASQAKVYGSSDPVLTYTVTPALLTGDSFTGALSRSTGENVGSSYAINQGDLSAGNKYLITFVSKDFAITAKPITVTADASQTKVYGASNPVYTYTVSPSLVSGDSFTGALTRTTGENIGAYAINQGSLSAGSNYTITYVAKDFTITAKPITVTADASQTKVYGTVDPVYTYTVSPSLVSGDSFTGALTRTAGENIGAYAITQGSLSAGSNYTITYVSKDFTITAKPITVTADASQTKVYGASNPVYTYTVSPSLVSGDLFTGALTRTAGENIGAYAINQGSLSAGSNYNITYVSKDFTITAKPITVTADASQTKVYGAVDPVYTYTVSPSLVSGDSFTGALTRTAGENIGAYAITQGSLTAGSNYNITYVSKDFTITAKPITVTANVSQTKVYGTTDPTFTYSVSPSLVSGDSFTGSLTRAAGENIGTYAINQGSLSAGSNYTISYVSKDFAITAKPITVTANVSQTKVYGTANPLYTYTVSPSLISGDAFTGLLSRVAGENVGTYAIQQGSLSAGSNYTISYVSKDFTITAKPITVTANVSQTKVYGTANPVYTYTVSPSLISGDSFTGALSRVTGENVGTYAIQQGSLSAGSNYTISYVSKDFAITAKPITVTVNASQTKVYGTSDPVFTYTVSPSLITGDSFTGALSRATGEDVGTYAIAQGSLTAGTNYLISYVGANFSITKANQTISWNQILELGCDSGSSKNLTATASSGLPVSYVSSNTNIATISNGVLTVHDYGFTTLTASQAGNNNYFPATVVVLTVTNSQPNLIRKQFEDIIFFDNSSKQFVSYTWYKDGVLVSGQTSQFYKENGALNGIYYAKATRLDGMVVTSCPLILSPTIEDEYIKIAPNPVKSNASYELLTNVSSSKLQNAHVEVYSVGGMLMQNVVTSQNTVKLTAPVVEGLYIVKMTLSNGKIFTKNLLVKN